jgi:hypothetical protein
METVPPAQILKSMTVVYYALMASQFVIFATAYYLSSSGLIRLPAQAHDVLRWAAPGVTLAAVFIGRSFRVVLLRSAARKAGLEAKLRDYLAASVIPWAFLEGANLLNAAAMLTGQRLYLGLYLVVLAAYGFSRPTLDKIDQELNLTPEEAGEIRRLS